MADKKQVRGLMDLIPAMAEGVEWEYIGPPIGLGLGATPDAQRWAEIGYLQEQLWTLKAATKRKRGRPRKESRLSADSMRAFILWCLANGVRPTAKQLNLRPKNGTRFTNRELIQEAKKLPINPVTLFRGNVCERTIEQSVARGRTALRINHRWQSKVCEKMTRIYSQTT